MTSDSIVKNAPKAAGCLITTLDIPRICASLSCYGGQLGYGACSTTLGFAVPLFAEKFDISIPTAGSLFVLSGIGCFVGIMLCSKVLANEGLLVSKTILSALCVWGTGVAMFMTFVVSSFAAVQVLTFLVFLGLGAADNFATVALAEMWGQRVQPWMQTKTAAYASGCMLPTIIIQAHDATYTARFSALLCFTSVLGIVAEHVLFLLGWAGQVSTITTSPLPVDAEASKPDPVVGSNTGNGNDDRGVTGTPSATEVPTQRRPFQATESTGLLSGAPTPAGQGRYRSVSSAAAVPTMASVQRMLAMERGCKPLDTTSASANYDVDREKELMLPLQSSLTRSFEAVRDRSRSRTGSVSVSSVRSASRSVYKRRSNTVAHIPDYSTAMGSGTSSEPAGRFLNLPQDPDDAVLSSELVLLGLALESATVIPFQHQEPSGPMHTAPCSAGADADAGGAGSLQYGGTDIVQAVLDATEYCQVSEQDRENGFYEPDINRTLAFVPTKVVHQLDQLELELEQEFQQQQRRATIAAGTGEGKDYAAAAPPTTTAATSALGVGTGAGRQGRAFSVARIQLLSTGAKLCLAGIVFLQAGLGVTIPGWTSLYITQNHIGPGTASTGGRVSSVYFCFLTLGAFLSIPLSVGFSTSTLLRAQLLLLALGVCIIALAVPLGGLFEPAGEGGGEGEGDPSEQGASGLGDETVGAGRMGGVLMWLYVGYAVMGYGMSVVVPLCLTMVNDYGLTMDPSSVSMAIMGGAVGGALVPTFVGYMISFSPTHGFVLSVLGFGLAMPFCYLQAHRILVAQTAVGTAAQSVAITHATTDLDGIPCKSSGGGGGRPAALSISCPLIAPSPTSGAGGRARRNSYQKARGRAFSLVNQQVDQHQVSELDTEVQQ